MKKIKTLIVLALLLSLFGCATQQNIDPLEGMNRSIYGFNEVVDNSIMKPVSQGYKAVMPDPAVKGINNFFNNIRDFITVINDVLQLKVEHAANDAGRVLVNTTVGLLGFIDVHTMSGGERRKEDFGQTLAYYGWSNSELLNASDILDQAALDPYTFQRDAYLQYREKLINDGNVDLIDYKSSAENAFEPYEEDAKPTDVTDVSDDIIIGQLDLSSQE